MDQFSGGGSLGRSRISLFFLGAAWSAVAIARYKTVARMSMCVGLYIVTVKIVVRGSVFDYVSRQNSNIYLRGCKYRSFNVVNCAFCHNIS